VDEAFQASATVEGHAMSESVDHSSVLPQRPSSEDRTAWARYWQKQGQSWRTEPEIDEERQKYLAERRSIPPDIEKSLYPFQDVKLSRAEVEWLLATHENGRGPVDYLDQSHVRREGIDLRGANLCQVDLSLLPLSRLRGSLGVLEYINATEEQRRAAAVCMEGANLWGTALWEANLNGARLAGADMMEAYLENSLLFGARLQGASLIRANLKRALLKEAHLEGTDLSDVQLAEARLGDVRFADEHHRGPQLAEVHWSDVNLTVVDWSQVTMLGDEYEAHQKKRNGMAKDGKTRLQEHQTAVRANRQLAMALQSQGLNEDAARFAYHAQVLQRKVFWRQRALGKWFFSWFLSLLAGYGYKPARSFLAYLLIIGTFMVIYYALGSHLSWNEALVVSMTAFHGRGFFPGTFSPGDPLAFASAVEAFVGLIIEITLIATLTQRFFGK
jgi:uncharacterized protein YjbI with pentapeptide repeats